MNVKGKIKNPEDWGFKPSEKAFLIVRDSDGKYCYFPKKAIRDAKNKRIGDSGEFEILEWFIEMVKKEGNEIEWQVYEKREKRTGFIPRKRIEYEPAQIVRFVDVNRFRDEFNTWSEMMGSNIFIKDLYYQEKFIDVLYLKQKTEDLDEDLSEEEQKALAKEFQDLKDSGLI